MKRTITVALVTFTGLVAGCPNTPDAADGPTVSDVSSEQNVPNVAAARVRVQIVNPSDCDADALVAMQILGAGVHEAARFVPANASAVVIGPDAGDELDVSAAYRGVCASVQIPQQTFAIGDGFQEGDTVVVVLADPSPPVLLCPADVTIDCTSARDPSVTRAAEAVPACEGAVELTFADEESGECPRVIRRTWTATDVCGLTNTCVQTITIEDTTPPTLECEADVVASCTDAAQPGIAPVVFDNCDLDVQLSFEDIEGDGCLGAVTRVWTATDACGNSSTCTQTVQLQDETPPALDCPADVTVDCFDSTEPEHTGIATATDVCDTSPLVSYEDLADDRSATIVRVWTAVDACGNVSSCEQRITVADLTPPVLICGEDIQRPCLPGKRPQLEPGPFGFDPLTAVPLTAPEAYDLCDPNPPTLSVEQRLIGEGCPIIVERTWTAVDSSGNVSTCTQVIRFDPVE